MKTALVTGGNRGLGKEVGRQLAASGWHVILTSRDLDAGRAAAADVGRAGGEVSARQLDVTDRRRNEALAGELAAEGVTLDALVNNAGRTMRGFDAEVARETLAANFFGALHLTEALLPRIADGGAIVFVSSGLSSLEGFSPELAARFRDPALTRDGLVDLAHAFIDRVADGTHAKEGWPSSAYKVSKASLNALARIFGKAFADRRIKVNAVDPGWVKTDMGGPSAPRELETGGQSIAWGALLPPDGPSGGFFRDGKPVRW